MHAADLAATLWRRKLVVLAVFVLVAGAGDYYLSRQVNVYESSAEVALLPDTANANSLAFYGEVVKSLLPTYERVVGSRTFLDGVAGSMPFPTSGRALSHDIHARSAPNAGALRILAHSGDPARAAMEAEVATSAFVQQYSGKAPVTLTVVDTARVPDTPVAPRPTLILLATGVLALALAVAAGLTWDRLFGRVAGSEELALATGMAVLGVIPEARILRKNAQIVAGTPSLGKVEESFRTLRTNVMFAIGATDLRSFVVTSISPAEGKSTVAANLAVMIAELGSRVLLIDADVHRPRQHELFDLDNDLGLTELVTSNAEPESLLRATGYPGLQLVTAGPPLANRSQEVGLYLKQLPRFSPLAEIVIVDSPPLQAGADVRLLAAATGSVLLAVRAGANGPRQLTAAVDSLRALDARILGTVLTRAHESAGIGATIGYYGYYAGAEATEE